MEAADKFGTPTALDGDAAPPMSPEPTYNQQVNTSADGSNEVPGQATLSSVQLPAPDGFPANTSDFDKDQHQKFTVFSKLPIELRHEIWSLAAVEEPRIIEIAWVKERHDWQFRSNARAPGILFATQESRQITAKSYKPFFFSDSFTGLSVDWYRDIIHFRPGAFNQYRRRNFHSHDLSRHCRQLMLDSRNMMSEGLKPLENFEQLEVLSIVFWGKYGHAYPIESVLSMGDVIQIPSSFLSSFLEEKLESYLPKRRVARAFKFMCINSIPKGEES